MTTGDSLASVGVALMLTAFFLNLARRLNAGSLVYQWLNTVGAGLAATGAVLMGSWPFVVLEGMWFLASAAALIRRRFAANTS